MDLCAYETQSVSKMRKILELVLFRMPYDRAQLDDYNDIYNSYSAKKWTCAVMERAASIFN